MRQQLRRPPPYDEDRLQLSVHYASTPALSTNSAEENSVNSEDFEISSSTTSSSSQGYGKTLLTPVPYSDYASSNASSASHYQHHASARTLVPVNNSSYANSVTSDYGSSTSSPHPRHHHNVVPSPYSSTRNQNATVIKLAAADPQKSATVSSRKISQIHRPKSLYHLNEQFFTSSPLQEQQQQQQQSEQQALQQEKSDLTVTEADLRAIDTCYRGHQTRVFVCTSLANLYTAHLANPADWQLRFTGIPVLVLDTGASRSRVKRQIQLLLVEKGTCFTLWKDLIDIHSQYNSQDEMFHVFKLSTDNAVQIGLSFDSSEAAKKFHSCLAMLTSDPANLNGNVVNSRKQQRMLNEEAKLRRKQNKNYVAPSKSEISLPCGFQHVVSVGPEDMDRYFSLQAFVRNSHVKSHGPLMQVDQPELQQQTQQIRVSSETDLVPKQPPVTMAKLSLFQSSHELNI